MILVIMLYALCALMFTLSKSALAYAQPIFFVGIRMVIAGILLGGYYVAKVKLWHEQFVFSWRDWPLLLQVILFHIYLTYVFDLCGLKGLTSIESSFIYNLSPFVAALFSYLMFSEKMTLKKWLGLSIGFLSLLPEFIKAGLEVSPTLVPKLITLGAVVSSAYGWVVVRKLVKDKGYSSIFVNGLGMFFGGLLAFITSYAMESWSSPVTDWIQFIKLTLLLIVVANIIFYNLYGYLLRFYTATFLAFAGFLCPLFTALFGWLFLGEVLSLQLIVSLLIVSVGLFIFYHEELRQGYSS